MTRDAQGNELGPQQRDAIAIALGLKPDPAKLAADLQAAQQQAAAHRTSERQARIELAVLRAAPGCGANPDALLDSRSFLSAVSALDPGAPDFADRVKTAIGDAAAANTAYQRRPPQSAGSGKAGDGSEQWTMEKVRASKPAELSAAMEAGLLRDLGYAPRKPGRGR